MRQLYYWLEGHEVVPVSSDVWSRKFQWATEERLVAKTQVGATEVSTVFLGLDHGFAEDGPPILFETMCFLGPLDGETERYVTWDEAEAGHARWVAAVRAAEGAG